MTLESSDGYPIPGDNPLTEIQRDMEQMIKRYNELYTEFTAYKEKTETENRKTLLSFLEIADAFENIFNNIAPKLDDADRQAKKWVGNFRTIYRLLQRTFKNIGLTSIEIIPGEKVNPFWHNVVEVSTVPDCASGTIFSEIRKGYMYNGILFRAVDIVAVKNNK
jgi:molecular chaperone GrpE (heat shock protein)